MADGQFDSLRKINHQLIDLIKKVSFAIQWMVNPSVGLDANLMASSLCSGDSLDIYSAVESY